MPPAVLNFRVWIIGMNTQRIYVNNDAFQLIEVLKANRNKRYKRGAFLVEGVRNINGAVHYGWVIESLIYSFERELSGWARGMVESVRTDVNYELAQPLMARLSGKEDTSEMLAIVRMREGRALPPSMPDSPVFVLFDRPSNKGNLGTLIRSCDAIGASMLIVTGHAVDVYDPEVVAASMGSLFAVPVARLSDNGDIDAFIVGLRERYPRLRVIGTTAHLKTALYDLNLAGPVLFLIGNETDGLNRHLMEIADDLATIPMAEPSSASSLNVSCAATVMLYEAARQRAQCEKNKNGIIW